MATGLGVVRSPRYSALRMSSTRSFASPNSICVFCWKKSGFSTPAYPLAMPRFITMQVLAFHTAQKYHGGLGATYVLIKKGSAARQTTSENLERAGHYKP